MSPDELDTKIRELLAEELHLEDGVMMMPLKESEIGYLHDSIRHLVNEMRDELAAIRDLAYRGTGSPADALTAIHARACRALNEEN